MNENDKPYKIVFAPGCFDNFDGTQEELNQLVSEIEKMFEGKSKEEIEATSQIMTDDEFDELPEEVQNQILHSVLEDKEQDKRKLQ
jgi:hypothetical protein